MKGEIIKINFSIFFITVIFLFLLNLMFAAAQTNDNQTNRSINNWSNWTNNQTNRSINNWSNWTNNQTNASVRDIREKIKERLTNEECVIKIEREIEIEGGLEKEKFKKKIECRDGRKGEVKIEIDNKSINGSGREKIRYKFENKSEIEVETEGGFYIEEVVNGTQHRLVIKCKSLQNVTNVTDSRICRIKETEIKIMPDEAFIIALNRSRIEKCSEENNCTIKIKEKIHNNIPRVVYNIELDKPGKFLGVFKLEMKVRTEIDPETGEVIVLNKPWWAFLVPEKNDN
ncbi:MAG: hypothetical protein QXX55_01280 [Candidatus Pacearchaeota archaeon]